MMMTEHEHSLHKIYNVQKNNTWNIRDSTSLQHHLILHQYAISLQNKLFPCLNKKDWPLLQKNHITFLTGILPKMVIIIAVG